MSTPKFTVYYNAGIFREEDGTQRTKTCATQLERARAGEPFCYRPCVYKVRKVSKYGAWLAYYCREDFPAELRELDVVDLTGQRSDGRGDAA